MQVEPAANGGECNWRRLLDWVAKYACRDAAQRDGARADGEGAVEGGGIRALEHRRLYAARSDGVEHMRGVEAVADGDLCVARRAAVSAASG